MKTAIQRGVEWIALNDEPGCLNAEEVWNQVTVLMLADIYAKDPKEVARQVVEYRKNQAYSPKRFVWRMVNVPTGQHFYPNKSQYYITKYLSGIRVRHQSPGSQSYHAKSVSAAKVMVRKLVKEFGED